VTVLSVNDILLPVDEPVGDLELSRVLHDGDDSLELIGVELTSTRRRIIEKSSVFIFVNLLRYHRSLFPRFSHSAYSSLDLSLPSTRHENVECRLTACRGRHQPSCRRCWRNDDQHP
jgi:hypothetical protein